MISDKKPREHIQGKKETTQVRIKPRERMSHKPKVEMTNIYKMSKKSQIILKKKKKCPLDWTVQRPALAQPTETAPLTKSSLISLFYYWKGLIITKLLLSKERKAQKKHSTIFKFQL